MWFTVRDPVVLVSTLTCDLVSGFNQEWSAPNMVTGTGMAMITDGRYLNLVCIETTDLTEDPLPPPSASAGDSKSAETKEDSTAKSKSGDDKDKDAKGKIADLARANSKKASKKPASAAEHGRDDPLGRKAVLEKQLVMYRYDPLLAMPLRGEFNPLSPPEGMREPLEAPATAASASGQSAAMTRPSSDPRAGWPFYTSRRRATQYAARVAAAQEIYSALQFRFPLLTCIAALKKVNDNSAAAVKYVI